MSASTRWKVPRSVLAPFGKILIFLLIWGLLYAPLLVPFLSLGVVYAEVVGAITMLATVWIVRTLIERRRFSSIGFERDRVAANLAKGLALGTAMMVTLVAIDVAARCGDVQPARLDPAVVAAAALATIANTLVQEVLVRGYVQQTLERSFGIRAAVLLSSLIFTLLHAPALHAFLPALNIFLAGILLGTAAAVTGNLWLPWAIHFGWNFVQGPIFGLVMSGNGSWASRRIVVLHGPRLMTGGPFGIEGSVTASIVTMAAIIVVGRWRGRRAIT